MIQPPLPAAHRGLLLALEHLKSAIPSAGGTCRDACVYRALSNKRHIAGTAVMTASQSRWGGGEHQPMCVTLRSMCLRSSVCRRDPTPPWTDFSSTKLCPLPFQRTPTKQTNRVKEPPTSAEAPSTRSPHDKPYSKTSPIFLWTTAPESWLFRRHSGRRRRSRGSWSHAKPSPTGFHSVATAKGTQNGIGGEDELMATVQVLPARA